MKTKFILFLLLITLVGSLTSCQKKIDKSKNQESLSSASNSSNNENTEDEKPPPEEFMVTSKNNFDYQSGLECSAYASAYVLRHYGEKASGIELFKTFPSKLSEGGVAPNGITTFFNERGYRTEYICNATVQELKKEISKGAPVIVFIHVSEPYTSTHYTHYVPIVGYDKDYFYFAESLSDLANCKDEKDIPYNRKTEITKFERLWSNIDSMWDNPYFSIQKKS